MSFYNPTRASIVLIVTFSFTFALNLTSSFGQKSESSDNYSPVFDPSPATVSMFDAEFKIPGFKQSPTASYSIPHVYEKKGGGRVILLPTIVFEPRTQNVKCEVDGECGEDVKTEIQGILASDPLLQIIHKVNYNQKDDELEALFEIQFYPEQFEERVAEHIKTNEPAKELTQGKPFSYEQLNLSRNGDIAGSYPRLEFRLDRGNGDGDSVDDDPDLLAYRNFRSGQKYNGTASVWVKFCRFKRRSTANNDDEKHFDDQSVDDDISERSSLDSFRVFCRNCSNVKARLDYCSAANWAGQGSSKISINFDQTEEILSDLETIADRQGDSTSLPIVDRDTMNKYVRMITGTIEQTVTIDPNGDGSLQKTVNDSLKSGMKITREIVSNLLVKEFRYGDSNFNSVLKKYLEPIIHTKIEDSVNIKDNISEEEKSEQLAKLKDLNLVTEVEGNSQFGPPKVGFNLGGFVGVNFNPTNNQATLGQFLGIDSDHRESNVKEISKATSDRINQAEQTTENFFVMDCKDFSLYELNVGNLRACIEMLQNVIVTRNGIARETTGLVPLSVTTDAIKNGVFRDVNFYRRNYEELKRQLNEIRVISGADPYEDI